MKKSEKIIEKELTLCLTSDKIYIKEKGKVRAVYKNGEPSDVGFAVQKYLEDNHPIIYVTMSDMEATDFDRETRIVALSDALKKRRINLNFYNVYCVCIKGIQKKYVCTLRSTNDAFTQFNVLEVKDGH